MRLLQYNDDGEFSMTQFFDDIPPYAILSHTWGLEEVTFKDMIEGNGTSKAGFGKIQFCGEQAGQDRIQYFWVDTCCIDKSNNTELAEAINSMFRWYRDAAKCYVYLSDVSGFTFNTDNSSYQLPWESAFRASRWFTRGWTLQELLAPNAVEFFSRQGKRLGDKRTLKRQIHEITGIPVSALEGSSLSQFGVDERLSWAEDRQTTRQEDKAYSLLGIFAIYLPLIYGEGRENAFKRLLEEIDKPLKGLDNNVLHRLEHIEVSALSIDRRVTELHQLMLDTRHAVLCQPEILRHILQPVSPYDCQLRPIGSRPFLPWYAEGHVPSSPPCTFSPSSYLGNTNKVGRASISGSHQEKAIEKTKKEEFMLRRRQPFFGCEPTSSFEKLPNYAEIYTVDERLPTCSFIVTSSNETHCSIQSRTNCYRILYRKSARQWARMEISLEIFSSSRYWTVTKLPRVERLTPGGFIIGFKCCSLPQSLLKQIQEYLSGADDQGENSAIQFSLSSNNVIQKHQSPYRNINLQSSTLAMGLSNMAQDILVSVGDLGCQQIAEKHVAQIEMIEPPIRFASLVDGILLYEAKFFRNFPSLKDLYNIQVLRGMEGVPGFPKLVGIVVTDPEKHESEKHLKSYLVELPQTKWHIMSDFLPDASIMPWERREDLARQVVEAVRQLHRNSFCIGTLWRARPPMLVDICGHVQFWSFDKQFAPSSRSCCYPPEYDKYFRDTYPAMNEAEFPLVTPKADIFCLGMALWYLAMGYPSNKSLKEPAEETQHPMRPFEFQWENGPSSVVLPRLPESIPKYYCELVDQCRSIIPNDRPSAGTILEKFPSRGKSLHPRDEISGATRDVELSLSSMRTAFTTRVWCSFCWDFVQGTFFHCDLCEGGDFDLCSNCFDQGRHCQDERHLLVEMEDIRTVSKRYHSMMRNSDVREITELAIFSEKKKCGIIS